MNIMNTLVKPLIITGLLFPYVSTADNGVTSDKIVLGQSAAFEGPASALGLGMRLGLQAAFAEVNTKGGINGRSVELITYDDGYEPEKAITNTNTLIEKDKVFALIGSVGTPTSKAAQPVAKTAGVPFIGPFTGAGFLRDPSNTNNVVNVRGSYDQETEAWIKHLTEDLGASRIAILYQDDSFGRAGLSGVTKAMEKRGIELVAKGTYQRNTVAVKKALLTIRKAKPDAVVMVGSYKPIAEFVKLAKRVRMSSTFVTISFVGSKALANELEDAGKGVVVTQVVPLPHDKNIPLIKQYHSALSMVDPKATPGFVSLEGYVVGRLMVEALGQLKGEITRSKLINEIKRIGTFDLGGLTLEYGPGDNQGMDNVYLSVLKADGTFKYVEKLVASIDE